MDALIKSGLHVLLLLLRTLIDTIAVALCRSEYIVRGESASVGAVEATKKMRRGYQQDSKCTSRCPERQWSRKFGNKVR
jgi:hypothetical protein